MHVFLLIAIALLCGCSHRPLEVRSHYLSPVWLASERVNTPDPSRECFEGQEVVVRWSAPPAHFCQDLKLIATFRFGNRALEQVVVPLKKSWGYWTYRLISPEYWNKCGLVAYKVDLCAGDQVIYAWRHHVWSEIINLRE